MIRSCPYFSSSPSGIDNRLTQYHSNICVERLHVAVVFSTTPLPSRPHTAMQPSIQLDPLNSPFPIPWNWVLATLSDTRNSVSRMRYFRTQSLLSPDGRFAAYSRIQLVVESDFTRSRVSSAMFVEDLQTGDLKTIPITAPFADNPFMHEADQETSGTIAIVIPVAWSPDGDRILAREFESMFGTGLASDFAVIWDHHTNRTHTLAPSGIAYSNAILLGWSRTHPNRALFRAGMMGDPQWEQWAVDPSGTTDPAPEDQPITFGQYVNHVWAGPQAYR
ncbi:hypothetical protein [Leptolyngbya sp. FACHB-8]|uniref:hypothetical protein n=2 Tax=unclassified Leptolyngbya TaxID=2650499 RepID=UPI0018EFAA29